MTPAWSQVRLDELTEFDSPITYGVVKPGDSGEVLFIRGGDLVGGRVLNSQLRTITSEVSEQYKRTLLRGGELLICLVGQPGQVAVAPPELAGANIARQVGLIRLRKDVDAEFVSYYLQSPDGQSNLGTYTGGSVQQVINLGDLRTVIIPLPPLPEQQRIVTILDEAFDGIATAKANAEKNLQNARALFESHLQSVFTQRGEGWVEKSVGELVANGVLIKPFDGNHGEIHPTKADFIESGVPFIMASDLKNGKVDTANCKFISRKLAESLRVGFAKDSDVLVSHKGTIGRSAILTTNDDYIILTPQVTSYRIKDQNQLYNRFIRYFFMSPGFQQELIKGAEGGATRAYIGITKQLDLRFRFPSLEEQKTITKKLDLLIIETQHLESIYQQKLIALDALKKSLLNQAFTGQL